ncbi:MAG: hypothetical protein PUE85_01665 [Firmicutes bacterium]|nr:hypothetical protein [Bacillota bacterium]
MADNRSCGQNTVCIDCGRVLDSCKDKDCFADTRVFLTGCGQELIEKTAAVRVKNASIAGAGIDLEPIRFNRGFYQIYIRFYVKLVFEACVGPGRTQEFDGIAVCDKKVILYGSEGSVNIFSSDGESTCSRSSATTNMPKAVVETVDPVVLSMKIADSGCGCGCCSADDIPDNICGLLDGPICSNRDKNVFVTLGFFSVVRIERPGQFLVNASEYDVPEKECVMCEEDDPCAVFDKMAFPTSEFSPPSYRQLGGCDCKR